MIERGMLWVGFSTRQGARQHGVSLVELLVALAILALVITVPLLTIASHESRLEAVDDRAIAWQLIANEVELQRHRPFHEFRHNSSEPFVSLTGQSPLAELSSSLRDLTHSVRVEEEIGGVARVHLRLEWGPRKMRREAELTILRSDVPGGTLW